ncbi:hypothetical protein ALC53_11672 [Atta colombica]|uniref:Uncharacterized protein n=1 Tax=Atta colombica TaxID=520822 RepID=A0A195B1A7_9HYME|nr:hypothetical protein ALC53_11672 [Atta colombica]
MVAVLEEKGLRKMARRVYEPCNRRERRRIAETEVEVAKTEVEEVAAVKVATKVELGVAFRMDPHGRIHREGGKESAVCWAKAGCTLRCKSGMGSHGKMVVRHSQLIPPYIYKHVLKKVDYRNPAGWCGFTIIGKRQSMKENVGAVPRGGGGP